MIVNAGSGETRKLTANPMTLPLPPGSDGEIGFFDSGGNRTRYQHNGTFWERLVVPTVQPPSLQRRVTYQAHFADAGTAGSVSIPIAVGGKVVALSVSNHASNATTATVFTSSLTQLGGTTAITHPSWTLGATATAGSIATVAPTANHTAHDMSVLTVTSDGGSSSVMPCTVTAEVAIDRMAYWLDADDVAANGADNESLSGGDPVTAWVNRGSGGSVSAPYTYTTPSIVRPSINGLDSLSFDGQLDNYAMTGSKTSLMPLWATGRYEFCAVVLLGGYGETRVLCASTNTGASPGAYWAVSATNQFQIILVGSNTVVFHNNAGAVSEGEWHIIRAWGDGVTSYASVDGATPSTASMTAANMATVTGTKDLSIGLRTDVITQSWVGEIAHLSIATETYTDAVRASIYDGLKRRFGL